jgi:hypothetical protein
MTRTPAVPVRPRTILPDPYWSSMILGRLVHLHLTLVEKQLFLDHRDVEQALLASDRVTAQLVGRLDGTHPVDRVLGRLWRCVLGQPLQQTITLPERCVVRELPGLPGGAGLRVLVLDDAGDLGAGMTRALHEIDTYGLAQVVCLGVGLVGTAPLPRMVGSVSTRECVLLPAAAWTQTTRELADLVLAGAARSLALLWASAEVRAYRLPAVPPTATRLADDFATGVLAELHRRQSSGQGTGPQPADPGPAEGGPDRAVPVQEPALPLVSELVRCWWPAPGRAHHIFGSPFDYLSTLEADHACG